MPVPLHLLPSLSLLLSLLLLLSLTLQLSLPHGRDRKPHPPRARRR